MPDKYYNILASPQVFFFFFFLLYGTNQLMNETKSLTISKKSEFFNQHKQNHIVTELDIRNRKLVYKMFFKNNAESYSKQCAV